MAKRTSEQYSDSTLDLAKRIEETEGPIPSPERYAKDGIMERREHVWRFLARRVPQTVMAKLLNVSRRTIADDVKWWKEQAGEQVHQMMNDPQVVEADIGMTSMRLEGIAQAAMGDYELARKPQEKNAALNTAIKAEDTRIRLMINTGVYPKAGEEINVSHNLKATFTARLGEDSPLAALDDPAAMRRVMSAAEKILKTSAKKNDALNVIDVEAIPKPDVSQGNE